MVDLYRSIQIAKEAVAGGANWIEAGTPLIKSEGINAVRELKKALPGTKIVADMKTVDTGAMEVEMAAKAGADIVILLAIADDSTIKDALRAARKYGVQIMTPAYEGDPEAPKVVPKEQWFMAPAQPAAEDKDRSNRPEK